MTTHVSTGSLLRQINVRAAGRTGRRFVDALVPALVELLPFEAGAAESIDPRSGRSTVLVAAPAGATLPIAGPDAPGEVRYVPAGPSGSRLCAPMLDARGKPLGRIRLTSERATRLSRPYVELVASLAARAGAELERERTLEDLAASEARYRMMVEQTHELVYRWRGPGRITFANEAFCRFFGKRREELVGHGLWSLVHPDDVDRIRSTFEAMDADRPSVTLLTRVLLTSGEVRWTEWVHQIVLDASGRVLEFQGQGRDVTDRVRTEERLTTSEARFRYLAEASKILARSLDLETTLQRVARLAVPWLADSCSVTLFEPGGLFTRVAVCHVDPEMERLLRSDEATVVAESPGLRRLYEDLEGGQPVLIGEFGEGALRSLALGEEGERRARLEAPRAVLLAPLAGRERTLGALSLVSSRLYSDRVYGPEDLDLAMEVAHRAALAVENARYYQELRDADRRKDEFLAVLAHELRNPAAAVSNALAVLRTPGIDDAGRDRALTIAQRQAALEARLIDDLMQAARLSRGKIELRKIPVELFDLARDTAAARRETFEAKSQRLHVDLPRARSTVIADPDRLEQIVSNLLDNASKYTASGGSIRLEGEVAGGRASLRIGDDGVGISPEALPCVFDPFFQWTRSRTRSRTGLGLGLTIVRQLVELHGGTVTARSAGLGHGSEFTIELPLAPGEVEPRPAASGTPAGDADGIRILVADDNVDAAESLASLLRAKGHEVRVVHDGAAAALAAGKWQPDLAILDIAMPGMDGDDAARAIRALPSGGKILLAALSGFGQPGDRARSLEAGFDRHLTKPARPSELTTLLKDAVDRRSAGQDRP